MKIAFILCGALSREVLAIIKRQAWDVDVYGIPAIDHMFPDRIAPDVARKLLAIRDSYDDVLVVFGDCGSRGALDSLLREQGLERLEGPHCYEMYGGDQFQQLMDEELGTFFLTDFLVRGFKGTIWRGMGLDRYPELLDEYFHNYRRIVYLAQTHDEELESRAEAIAQQLKLPLQIRYTGYNQLETRLVDWMAGRLDPSPEPV